MNEKKTKKDAIGTAADAVRKVIDAMPTGKEFHGWELKTECVKVHPELSNMYVETFLREMRDLRHLDYILVNKKESLYRKVGRC